MTANVLAFVNIIISVAIVWYAVANYRRTRWFLYAVFALVWLAWTAVYAFVLIANPANYNTIWFSTSIIRPLNVTTFGLVLLVMWYRYRNDSR